MKRRVFMIGSGALFASTAVSPSFAQVADEAQWAAWDDQVTPPLFDPRVSNPWGIEPRLLPIRVQANDGLKAGDIHVDAVARYLYHIQGDGTAFRFGVAIGRDGLYEPGSFTVGRKAKWPSWTPTANMIAREPDVYGPFRNGMPPGPENVLGSRALYLFVGSRDTFLRIHGTPFPESIGQRASSGCVRLIMAHINFLYESVDLGVRAVLHPAEEGVTARS